MDPWGPSARIGGLGEVRRTPWRSSPSCTLLQRGGVLRAEEQHPTHPGGLPNAVLGFSQRLDAWGWTVGLDW